MEEAYQFNCEDHQLYGVLHRPWKDTPSHPIILMVTGGPQTRYGSHRLYVQLARFLQVHGFYVFRFDYSGTGDSEGEWAGYKYAGPSIKAAAEFLKTKFPGNFNMLIWSLCDGAAASIAFAASQPDSLVGMILANPYTYNLQLQARTFLKYYYIKRLMQIDFWKKIVTFRFNYRESLQSLSQNVKNVAGNQMTDTVLEMGADMEISAEELMQYLQKLSIPVYFMLSKEDLTARQFYEYLHANKRRLKAQRIKISFIDHADHTFSYPNSKALAFKETISILNQHFNR